jgi:hypothetical protein
MVVSHGKVIYFYPQNYKFAVLAIPTSYFSTAPNPSLLHNLCGGSQGVPQEVVELMHTHFKILRKTPYVLRKIAGTFLRQLATLG